MLKGKLTEVEILRGIAMLSVVSIHVVNAGIANLPKGSSGNFLFNEIQGCLQFAVPLFIIISAMMAAYTNADKPLQIGGYYLKKIIRVGVPYIFWTFFYLAFQLFITGALTRQSFLAPGNWAKWFLLGKGYTHLYFMAVIMQFYILFPLLLRLARWVKDKPLAAFILALAPQIGIYWANKLWIYPITPYFIGSFAQYYCIAFAGMWLGLNYHKLADWLAKYWYLTAAVLLLSAGGYVYYFRLSLLQVHFNTFYMTMLWQFFSVSAALLLLHFANLLSARQNRLGSGLAWVGQYSFGIYLIHPVFTYLLVHYTVGLHTLPMLIVCLGAVLVISVLCGFIVKAMQAWNPTAYLFGAGRRKAAV